jgi:hypothetical protein
LLLSQDGFGIPTFVKHRGNGLFGMRSLINGNSIVARISKMKGCKAWSCIIQPAPSSQTGILDIPFDADTNSSKKWMTINHSSVNMDHLD